MKRIVFFIFLFSFVFANVGYYSYGWSFVAALSYVGSCSPGSFTCNNGTNPHCLCADGKMYTTAPQVDFYISSNYNRACLLNNAQKKTSLIVQVGDKYSFSSVSKTIFWYDSLDDMEFCKNKDGYIFNSTDNVWYPTNSGFTPICANGKVWSPEQEKCIDDFNTQRDKCYQKCGGEEFTKSFTVDSNGSSTCVCKLCSDIYNDFVQYCNTQGGTLKDFSCQDDGEKIVSLSSTKQTPDICSIPNDNYQSDANNSDNNLSDDSNVSDSGSQNNISNSNSQESTNDGSNNRNNSDGDNGSSSSNISQSNTDTNSSSKVDCCSYYKGHKGTWTSVNGCLEYTIPETGQKCRIKDDGLKCYVCSSGSSSDSNSSGSINDIVTKIDQTNSRLDKINNTCGRGYTTIL